MPPPPPPLAGKPPYATDEPDSFFGAPQQPQRRMRQPAPEDPNKRSSAYDVYDNYLKKDDKAAPSSNRDSGIGNLLLNMGDDSDDSDYEDGPSPAKPPGVVVPPAQKPPPTPTKTAALAAAVAVTGPPRSASQGVQLAHQQQQSLLQKQQPPIPRPGPQGPPSPPRQPQPIAAPRPGYAAPIAVLNGQAGAPPAPVNNNNRGPIVPLQIRPPMAAAPPPPPSGPQASAPHPLQPPITPITPAFIRPSTSPSPPLRAKPGITFSAEKPTPILRGNTEETLLPSRGEKGDDFWRRFSMVAKEPSSRDESSWLQKSQSRSNQMSRYVWVIGIFLIALIVGGTGVGIWLSRNSPGHQQPTAIGGSDDHSLVGTTTTTTNPATKAAASPSNSIKHVSPTNTVARRDIVILEPTPPAVAVRFIRKRHHEDMVW